MKINQNIAEALNAHVSHEATTAFSYLAMASWADVRGLSGFAQWFRKEAAGEMNHMHQFVKYLNDRDYQATFASIPAPNSTWNSVVDVVREVVRQEHGLTDKINDLMKLSQEEKDHFTASFLTGFIPTQISDQAEAEEILQRVELVGEDGRGIIMIDQELGSKP